jgi:MFS family permease
LSWLLRIIAGHLGSSLYTWTSVIGIVLAGLALGNYIGGRLADRYEVWRTLSILFIAASGAAISISISNDIVGGMRILWFLPWPARVAAHVGLVFFLPSCLLGMISPVIAKMALDLGRETGRTIGNVYAWGVAGSILGTFATGFYLVEMFRTTTIIMVVAAILAAIALFYRIGSQRVAHP